MSIKFIKTADADNTFDNTNVTIEIIHNSASLPDMLEAFTDFLRGCGYAFNGVVDIIEYDKETGTNDMDSSNNNTCDLNSFAFNNEDEDQQQHKLKRKRKKSK